MEQFHAPCKSVFISINEPGISLINLKAENMDYEKRTANNLLQQLDQLEKAFSSNKQLLTPETGLEIGGDSNALPKDSGKK